MSTIIHFPIQNCRRPGADPEAWFPDAPRTKVARLAYEADARQLCAGCPLTDACLERALERNERHGIWGGTTPGQRRRMRRLAVAS
ncbi:WhiB family transcriptional regulator [Actinoallomurus purpureus]|uniref:WhiB family transcriptional regulator n=1 Tax=Actinoallomurus purpureus TaxID=478114 RepID=UPI002093AEE4|nr:WhiB family transcriptional regulator [Actinoallomurus purpureus]MCO6011469.1 WhiB family transcriptional regulator [Actinoallomurus purpureus]